MSGDDADRPYSAEPVQMWEGQTIHVPPEYGTVDQIRWLLNHDDFSCPEGSRLEITRVECDCHGHRECVAIKIEWLIMDDTPRHLNAALLDGDDERYAELLNKRGR